jgi:hypothetical protein
MARRSMGLQFAIHFRARHKDRTLSFDKTASTAKSLRGNAFITVMKAA